MNARIVNLRTARKRRAKEIAKKTADQHAIAHGRTKTERDLAKAENTLATRRLDGHRRTDADEPE